MVKYVGERFLLEEIWMSTSNNRSTEEEEIRNLVESWAKAVRTKNLDGIMLNHSPEILMFDVPPPAQSKGIDAYKKTWDVFFAWFQDSGIFEINELKITAGEDVAYAAALMRCGGTEANGDKVELDFRLTICFRKIGGRWTVMHEHHSVPSS
jgi:ketosteroid isomerase-like protein